jgi:hypothetical protein
MQIRELFRRRDQSTDRELVGRRDDGAVAAPTQALTAEQKDRYALERRQMQALFAGTPDEALRYADSMVARVMRDRGFATEPESYRSAHEICMRSDNGKASEAEIASALAQMDALLDELLEGAEAEPATTEMTAR